MKFIKELEWTPLHCASEKEDLTLVEELLGKGADINAKDKYNRTPLSVAASKGNLPLVQFFLDEGANLNDGFPLHYSCEKGYTDIVGCLLNRGALVNLERENNYPVLIAASKGNLQVIKILMEHGADIHVVDKDKESALHWACDNGNEDLVSFLIDAGCNLDLQDRFGMTPLSICLVRQGDRPDLVKLLLSRGASKYLPDDSGYTYLHSSEHPESTLELIKYGVDVNSQTVCKETPLMRASFDCAKVLLQNKADPNIQAMGGWTSFFLIVATGRLEYVKEFLKAGVDVNVANAQNLIPLHVAAHKGHLEIVRELLEHGSFIDVPVINMYDINSDDDYLKFEFGGLGDKVTPLLLAAFNGHMEVCKLLLTHGADCDGISLPEEILQFKQTKKIHDWPCNELLASVRTNNLEYIKSVDRESLHVCDSMGWSPLHHAVFSNFSEMCSELIKKGASINALDKYERTPLSVASAKSNSTILNLLLDKGADVDLGLALHYAFGEDSLECMEELVKRNCDINGTDKTVSKNSVLIKAATDSKIEIMKMLLENKADANFSNEWGEAALHRSCRNDDFEAVQLLLNYGADVNAADTFKETPLMYACLSSNLDIVKLLLSKGVAVNVKDQSEWTPLHKAARSNFEGAVTELLKAGACVDACNDSNETPLFLCTESVTIMKALIENGADVNHCTTGGWTPLHETASDGDLNCAEILLDKANVNCASSEFVLPIYLASIHGHVSIVKVLLDRGSYVDPYILDIGVIRDDTGNLPLSESYHIVPGNTPLIGAASKGHLDVVEELCSHGAKVNAVNCEGNTALHEAVISGSEAVVAFLLTSDVDLDVKNLDQKTALDLAKERSNEELVLLISK